MRNTFLHFANLDEVKAYAAAEFERAGKSLTAFQMSIRIANSDVLLVEINRALEVFGC